MLIPAPQPSEIALFLSQPEAYHDGTKKVRLRQTPSSWVFLTDHYAYKLKKPMRCGAEDFSTLTLREKAFRNELRLGRRFAPRVYLSVVSVNRSEQHGFALRGTGPVVDWLLEMRRLDEKQSLAWLLEVGEVGPEKIESLAVQLASFYADQPPISLKADDFLASLIDRVEANRRRLLVRASDPTGLETAHRAQREFLAHRACCFSQRVCDGRIVDSHGDLRPEHIYFDSIPSLIGCTTVSGTMRWSDVADDLAVLAMECDRRGAPETGAQIKDAYVRQSGDLIRDDLFAFYKCYRAYCRAAMLLNRRAGYDTDEADGTNETELEIDHYLRIAAVYAKSLELQA